jgi:hypothetical protein
LPKKQYTTGPTEDLHKKEYWSTWGYAQETVHYWSYW